MRRPASGTLRLLLVSGLALAACGPVSCGRPRAKAAKPGAWQPREFLIGLRGAPPQRAQHYAEVAAAGFNVIVDLVGPDALDLADRHGLKLMAGRIGLDAPTLRESAWRQSVAQTIERYRGHPALWGYFLGDEPREAQLPEAAAVADFIRERDPERPFFLSVLPCDAWVGPTLPTGDYAAFLGRFMDAVRPPMLTWGHYPFRANGESPFYFENLELVRRTALDRGVPFCPMLQAAAWPGMPAPGEGELRWQAYTALAYGAKGVVWFSYWGAPGGSPEGIMRPDGMQTARYRWVASLNAELRALGPALLELRSAGVYHTGTVPAGATRLPVHGLVGSIEGGSFVIGEFVDRQGTQHLLVANKDYGREVTAKVTLNRPCRDLSWLDPATGHWRDLAAATDRLQSVVEIPLLPGGGKLLRLRR